MTDDVKEKLAAQGARLTAMHHDIVTLSDAAAALLAQPFALTYVTTQLHQLGQDHVESVIKGLATLRSKLEPPP